ncbi:AAA family ATPase [Actinoplanes sp. M2I2]|uniref:AAA family ATPase n=1 Tax=Actinoplanes sp. M2I2 TaxID=1734444 RepID=UPI002020B32A|nr:LuxR family transcriptional regulator [Actinoplanes sp. M2I2]
MRDDDEVELFGRAHEHSLLLEMLERARLSSGSTLVLRGDAGIGKSALLRLAGEQARERGMSVLAVTAVPTETRLPYTGVDQLLGSLLSSGPAAWRSRWEAALGRAGEPDSPAESYQLARAALTGVTTSAGPGRVLIVDDAQWLDQESWDILAFVGRRLADDKVCLLLGMRDGEESASRLSGAGLPEHRLEPLSAEAALALLRTVAPELTPALTQRVLREAAGNPLGLFELGFAAGQMGAGDLTVQDLPLTERLERTYALTISRLPMVTRSLILIAALDDAVDLGEVLTVAHGLHGQNVTAEDLAPAVTAGLLVADKEMVRFRHPLIRWSVARSASAPVRLATHAAIAAVLDGQEARQVWHLAAATVDTDAGVADRLARLAERADQAGSSGSAQRAWERSAQLSPDGPTRARRLLRAAHAGLNFSQFAKVRNTLESIDEDQLEPVERTELEWLRQNSIGFHWPYDQALALLTGLAVELQAQGRTELALHGLATVSAVCWWADLGRPVREQIVRVVEEMGLPESDPRFISVIAMVSPIEHGRVSLDRIRRMLLAPSPDVVAAQYLGTAASAIGDLRSSLAFLRTGIASIRRQGLLALLPQLLGSQALVAALLGDVHLTLTSAEEVHRTALETNQPTWQIEGRLLVAFAQALSGDDSSALATADEIERQMLAFGARLMVCQVALVRGVAHLAAGRPAAALDELSTLFDPADLHYHEFARLWAVPHLAEAAALSGGYDRLRAVTAECEPIAAKAGWPVLEASLAYASALLAPDDEADAAFVAALPRISADFPFERARLQLAYGAWLRRHHRVTDSRGQLRAAQQVFQALGTEPWAERARKELRASGEHPRRTPSAARTLTPQELQIAQLAASGLTNPEIAEQLFLAASTVSTHLHRVYAKLGVTGRKQLAPVLSGS